LGGGGRVVGRVIGTFYNRISPPKRGYRRLFAAYFGLELFMFPLLLYKKPLAFLEYLIL
jgi:hypothetical protein